VGLSECFALTLCLHTLSPRFVGYASSPHYVPTLCRKRKSKRMFRLPVHSRCALEPAVSAVNWRAHEVENDTAGDGGLQRSGFSVHSRCALEPAVSAVYWGAHGWRTTPPGTAGSSVPAFPFASDALWSPRSPRCTGERMDGERHRRGSCFAKATQDRRRVPAFRLFRSLQMRLGARGLRGSAETSPGTRPPSTPSMLVNDSICTAYCHCILRDEWDTGDAGDKGVWSKCKRGAPTKIRNYLIDDNRRQPTTIEAG
jgi:hypothetical protein